MLLPVTPHDMLRLPPDQDVAVPIRIYNPRNVPMTDVKAALSSEYADCAGAEGRNHHSED